MVTMGRYRGRTPWLRWRMWEMETSLLALISTVLAYSLRELGHARPLFPTVVPAL